MEREIFISKVLQVLKKCSTKDCKLWLAESHGRRWAYIGGYGEEYFLPPEKVVTFGKFAIFGENVTDEIRESLLKELGDLLEENDGKETL
ncbi:hypothetical protein [Kosmotoga pacifica]|uniref:Uncharacterized protein n=1 Tax=Kosmotoga pacifica TaxID=1330330 RepID=A0A0G2ZDU5_9BACT|nr:hypothetical protein [Kosmotoga pacifica]AKI97734.1 hypothetical protein IX53_07825 [Kosmotoga pacifica]